MMATYDGGESKATKPTTQRQVLDSLSERLDVLVQDMERRNSAKAVSGSRPPITEAQALARCIDALAELSERESSRTRDYVTMSGSYDRGSWGAGDRILRFLAARFGVSLVEVREVECSRPHADTIDPHAVLDAIQRSARQS